MSSNIKIISMFLMGCMITGLHAMEGQPRKQKMSAEEKLFNGLIKTGPYLWLIENSPEWQDYSNILRQMRTANYRQYVRGNLYDVLVSSVRGLLVYANDIPYFKELVGNTILEMYDDYFRPGVENGSIVKERYIPGN